MPNLPGRDWATAGRWVKTAQSRLETISNRPDLFLASCAAWFALEYYCLGPASFVPIQDFADTILPWCLESAGRGVSERLALWQPAIACGLDRLSLGFLQINWIPHLIGWLGGWPAYPLIVGLFYFISGASVYRLCRESLGLGGLASLYAGVSAAWCLNDTIGYQGGFHFLPLLLWSIRKLAVRLEAGKIGSSLALAAALGLLYSSASTMFHTLPFCLPAALLWFLLMPQKSRWETWIVFAIVCFFSILPSLPVVWAAVDNAPLSHRADWGRNSGAPPLTTFGDYLASVWSPVAIPGLVPALGITAWGWARRRWRGEKIPHREFAPIVALVLISAVEGAVLEYLKAALGDRAGFLKGFGFGRFNMTTPIFAAMCGAYGIEWAGRRGLAFGLVLAIIGAQSCAVKVRNLETWFFQGSYAANFQSPVLKELKERAAGGPFRVATIPHGLHPTYANAYGFETVDGHSPLYSKRFQRFWSTVISPLTAKDERFREYFEGWGNRIYLFTDNVEVFPKGIPFESQWKLDLLSLANTRYIISRHPLNHQDLDPILTQPPWNKLTRRERAAIRIRENFLGKFYFHLYENKRFLPRAFVTSGVRSFDSEKDLWGELSRAPIQKLRETALFLKADLAQPLPGSWGLTAGEVGLDRYEADRIALSLTVKGRGMLIVTNSFSPHWHCRVDGRPRPIAPAYGAFWGVVVGTGDRTVEFTYEPPYRIFKTGEGPRPEPGT